MVILLLWLQSEASLPILVFSLCDKETSLGTEGRLTTGNGYGHYYLVGKKGTGIDEKSKNTILF